MKSIRWLIIGGISIACCACLKSRNTTGANTVQDQEALLEAPAPLNDPIPPGVKNVVIKFELGNAGGSFDTADRLKPEILAKRFYATDGALIQQPGWISSLKIFRKNPTGACARFALEGEQNSMCGTSITDPQARPCGTAVNRFRVSEWDCAHENAPIGKGSPDDSLAIAVEIARSREFLGASENIRVILDYTAYYLNGTRSDPTLCFTPSGINNSIMLTTSGRTFDPTLPGCSDMSYFTYLKTSLTNPTPPFFMVIPPQEQGPRSVILPISSNSSLSTFMFSRIRGLDLNANGFTSTCNPAGASQANTPQCAGLILKTITLQRL